MRRGEQRTAIALLNEELSAHAEEAGLCLEKAHRQITVGGCERKVPLLTFQCIELGRHGRAVKHAHGEAPCIQIAMGIQKHGLAALDIYRILRLTDPDEPRSSPELD